MAVSKHGSKAARAKRMRKSAKLQKVRRKRRNESIRASGGHLVGADSGIAAALGLLAAARIRGQRVSSGRSVYTDATGVMRTGGDDSDGSITPGDM